MAAQTLSSLTMLTECVSAEHIAASARRTGFVKRVAKMTGKRLLALVTVGVWRDATTTRAQWAAQVTPWDDQLQSSPEAMYQRMHKSALALLQDMIRQALATVHVLEKVCDEGLFPCFPEVYLAESTGFARPDSLHALLPGSGGSAGKAGAKMQAVWDSTSSVVDPCALTPWNMPDQKDRDRVGA